MTVKVRKSTLIKCHSLSDLYIFPKFCEIILINVLYIKENLGLIWSDCYVAFTCHFMTLTFLKRYRPVFCLSSSDVRCLWLDPGFMHFCQDYQFFIFLKLRIWDNCAFTCISKKTERSHIPSTYFPPIVKSCITIVTVTTRILTLIESTDLIQISSVQLVLMYMCV